MKQEPWIDHLQFEKHPKPVRSYKEEKLRKIAKILGLTAVAIGFPLSFLVFVGANFQSARMTWHPFLIYLVVFCVLRLFVLWFALKHPLPGGLILIIDGVVLLIFLNFSTFVAPLSLPLISSGVLFVLSWYEHRKNAQSREKT